MADTETAPEEATIDEPLVDETAALEEDVSSDDVMSQDAAGTAEGRNVDALFNVKLDVRVVLGHNRMSVSELLKLTRGSVIELDRKIGDPVDIMVNDRLVARGDLIKIEGEMIGVALREILKDFSPSD